VHPLGFQLGFACEFEIVKIFDDQGDVLISRVAGSEYPEKAFPKSTPSESTQPLRFENDVCLNALRHPYAPLLSRATRDINQAVLNATDASFHCYRAIESVRK